MSGGPKWCELFLILYCTHISTKLKVSKTDSVTVFLESLLSSRLS